jgi:hypothetical protein
LQTANQKQMIFLEGGCATCNKTEKDQSIHPHEVWKHWRGWVQPVCLLYKSKESSLTRKSSL